MQKILAMVVLLGFVAGIQAEDVDNPTYKAWAAYKPGTTVTLKTISDSAGNKSESTMTYKLLELTADKAVVEMVVKTKVAGMEFDTPASKMEHAKTVKIEGKKPATVTKPEGVVKEGEETIKIGGKEFKTKWYETKVAGVEAKSWISETVPGSIVKMESKMTSPVAATTTMELVEIKTP